MYISVELADEPWARKVFSVLFRHANNGCTINECGCFGTQYPFHVIPILNIQFVCENNVKQYRQTLNFIIAAYMF